VGTIACGRLQEWELADRFFAGIEALVEDDEYDELERAWVLELLALERYQECVEILETRLVRCPEKAVETRFLLSGALGMLDRNEEAAKQIGEVQALLGDSVTVRSRVAWVKQRQKDFDGARQLYLASIEQFDQEFDDPDLRDQLRQIRIILAGMASQRGDLSEAEEWLKQVLDEYPDNPGALNDLGYLWVDHHMHLQRGYSMVKRAVEAEPENASYWDSLGWAAFRLARFAEAEAALLRAAELRPGDPEFLDHLGDVYAKSDRISRAVETWKQAAEIYRSDQQHDRWAELQQKIQSHETD
jgi:tetratricopeptide (TPR) repeat protein